MASERFYAIGESVEATSVSDSRAARAVVTDAQDCMLVTIGDFNRDVARLRVTSRVGERFRCDVVEGCFHRRREPFDELDRRRQRRRRSAAGGTERPRRRRPRRGIPSAGWLGRDRPRLPRGFILTGTEVATADDGTKPWPLTRAPMLLETSRPGVFAAGDARLASMKRVASAVGEGSIAVSLVHSYLETL